MSSEAGVIRVAGDETLVTARQIIATDPAQALALLRQFLKIAPNNAEAHRLSARAHRKLGQDADAEADELQAIRASSHDPELQRAAHALMANELHIAEPILKGRLKVVPTDVAAIRMLAELAGRIGRYPDAENLLRRAIELAPGFTAARSNLATVLHRQNRTAEALDELNVLLAADPENAGHANLKAAVLGRVGDFDEAVHLYEMILQKIRTQPKIWMSYGHTLKTVGRLDDSVTAYREALVLKPELGEVWWSLANLKTFQFTNADIATMEQALARPDLSEEDRFHLDFALGRAYETAENPATAFAHYAAGNALRRKQPDLIVSDTGKQVDRMIDLFTPSFLAERAGSGCAAPDPIFIVGMPRAGSTLIEQILSSHSLVEGTMELPDIPSLVGDVSRKHGNYPKAIELLSAEDFQTLGQSFIDRTQIQRKSGKPFFIDKLPNNWMQLGFIHLILPNARIVDARRHPLDCCFSNFKQHFAKGQGFSYDLTDLGNYYADYVRLMRHFDAVTPGKVHRVIHERLLDDPEEEIRKLLVALNLPFEEQCLAFHENKRAVRTASSEQVRRPINRDGVGQWQPFSEWLGPLRDALGPVLDAYPNVPERGENATA